MTCMGISRLDSRTVACSQRRRRLHDEMDRRLTSGLLMYLHSAHLVSGAMSAGRDGMCEEG